VLFSILGFYLLGKIKFAHDSDIQHIGIGRLFLVIGIFSFVLYLFTGLLGAPLKGLSSMLPSPQTSWTWKEPASPVNETGFSSQMPVVFPGTLSLNTPCSEPKHADKLKMPAGITGYFDYKQGLECAKAQGKPVLLDFKGHACANCKLMEAKVWSDPKILKRLQENFVIIALYVDDRTELPESEWFTSKLDGRIKKTIGKQNEDLEISKFNTNALPLYVITDSDGNPLNKPMPTNLNVEEYAKWLDEGVANFQKSR
jgi:thiol:disulfide interchange protein DsbD